MEHLGLVPRQAIAMGHVPHGARRNEDRAGLAEAARYVVDRCRRADDVIKLGHERRGVIEVGASRGAVEDANRQARSGDFFGCVGVLEADENGVRALDVGAKRL
jgi:hypothetical protein